MNGKKTFLVLLLFGLYILFLFPNLFVSPPHSAPFVMGAMSLPDGLNFLKCYSSICEFHAQTGKLTPVPGDICKSFHAMLFIPFQTVLGFPSSYNLFLILILTLNCYSLFVLLSRFNADILINVLLSLLVSINPVTIYFIQLGSIDRIFIFPVIFSLYFFMKAWGGKSWLDVVWMLLFCMVSFLSYFYYLAIFALFAVSFMLFNFRKCVRVHDFMALVSVAVLACFLFLLRSHIGALVEEYSRFRIPLTDYESLSIFGGKSSFFSIHPPLLIFAAAFIIFAFRTGFPAYLLVPLLALAVLSLGPFLRIENEIYSVDGKILLLPYYYLSKLSWHVYRYRIPMHFGVISGITLACFFAAVSSGLRTEKWKSLIALLLLALLLFNSQLPQRPGCSPIANPHISRQTACFQRFRGYATSPVL